MNRREYLEYAKERALKLEDPVLMWTSLVSDFNKRDDLRDHIAIDLGNKLQLITKTTEEVKKFIEGFA